MKKILLLVLVLFSSAANAVGPVSVSKTGPGKFFIQQFLKNSFSCNNGSQAQEVTELRVPITAGKRYRWSSCMYMAGVSQDVHWYFAWGNSGTAPFKSWMYIRDNFTNSNHCYSGSFVAADSVFKTFCGASGATIVASDNNVLPSGFSGSTLTSYVIVEEM